MTSQVQLEKKARALKFQDLGEDDAYKTYRVTFSCPCNDYPEITETITSYGLLCLEEVATETLV